MLTRQGWLVAVGAALLVVAGRLLGLPELYALGLVAAVLLALSLATVGASRLDLSVDRSIHPHRVQVGTVTRVELAIGNQRARRTPVLRLRDPVTGTRGAELLVAPLRGGERAVAAYRLPTDHRGLVEVGPLSVVVEDPFGLARLSTTGAPGLSVTVHPHVEPIDPLPYTIGRDPLAGARRPSSLGRSGEDFYALRSYVVGDDLRRVHWPSSARHDELLVRQQELPWQGRTTVLLDVRRSAHAGDSLEVAVSVAASIVTATARRRDLIRLITTAGSDSDFAPGRDHVDAILEHLAVVPLAAHGATLGQTVDELARRSTGGALVAVVAEVPDQDLRAIASLRWRYGSVTTVLVDRAVRDRPAPVGPPLGVPVLRVTRDTPLAAAWGAHLAAVRAGHLGAAR